MMLMESSMPTAAIYCRISLDDQGGAGVARQESDCRDLAARDGLQVVNVYVDNSVSAYSGVARPGFEQMIADAQAGMFDTIVVWATDRLYRRIPDLQRLVEELHDVPVVAVKSGRVDLSTADGRLHARLLGDVAAHSSEKTAERVAAAARQRSTGGRATTGSRPFGWERVDHGLQPDPVEAPALREAYRLLIEDGQNLSQIARWLTAEGFTGSKGGPITQARVSAILRAPRNGGLVAYRGEIVQAGNTEGHIVDETTWRQAQRILTAPGRKTKGRPANALLSGFLRCYKCGGTVRPSSNQSRAGVRYKTYACNSNHVSWRREDLDAVVITKIEEYLRENLTVLQVAAADAPDPSDALAVEADRLRDDIAALDDALASGALTVARYTTTVQRLDARLVEVETAMVPRVPSLARGVLTSADVVQAWRDADLSARRTVLSTIVDSMTVHPRRDGTVEISWSGQSVPEQVVA